MLLHFRIGKHSPSCLGKERSVESQLFCCSHFPFAVTTFHQQISYHFGISSVQHKEHRIFFPFTLCSPKSLLEIDGQREKHKQIIFIDCFQVSGQSKWHLLKACCHCAPLTVVSMLPSVAPFVLGLSESVCKSPTLLSQNCLSHILLGKCPFSFFICGKRLLHFLVRTIKAAAN